MTLHQFLDSQNYSPALKNIILDIQYGSIEIYKIINEDPKNVLGDAGQVNIQNESVKKLDIIANNIFIKQFMKNDSICALLSEENEKIIDFNRDGNYVVAMDPLDGSSNIDVNIPVGSIFSVLEKNKNLETSFLQPGKSQKIGCYVIYGTSTVLVFAIQNKVFGFTLNTKDKQYLLTHRNIKIPQSGNIFSINEGNYNSIDSEIKSFLNYCKELNEHGKRTHTGRFVGSLVADFHRNMLKGGIFIYPKTSDRPQGQLRLIYECNPIAFIAASAQGRATDLKGDILNKHPDSIHQRTPFAVGSINIVNKLLSFYK